MSDKTHIQWTDATWNPVTGCTRVSEGCRHCYAERLTATRLAHQPKYAGLAVMHGAAHKVREGIHEPASGGEARWTGEIRLHPDVLDQPLKWRKGRRIFVCDMSDLFHEKVPFEFIDRVFAVMALAPRHTFQILTKRPGRMAEYLNGDDGRWYHWKDEAARINCDVVFAPKTPLPNVWLGTSIEDQATADERIPELLKCPAAVRFLSVEPLLGPVDLGMSTATCNCCARWPSRWIRVRHPVGPELPFLIASPDLVADAGIYRAESNKHGALSVRTPAGLLGIKPDEMDVLPGVDWVIVGGESGPGARPCDMAWIRSIVGQCQAAGVACFVKQVGARPISSAACSIDCRCGLHYGFKFSKGDWPGEWPEDLRVREFPGEKHKAESTKQKC